jgi:hypothetical protein
MILNLNASMAEATRLTRAGRLAEAMALLQGLPQKSKSPEAPQGVDRNPMRTASITQAVHRHGAATLWLGSLDGA